MAQNNTVCETPPCQDAYTHQIWNSYLKEYKRYAWNTKILTTSTPASNLGYLAPLPGQFFMGAKLFIGTPWMRNKGVLKKILVWAMCYCMVSMATHS